MALTERLALLVTLDAQGAVKGFNDLGRAAEKNLKGSDERLDRMSSKFQKAGAGMLATAGTFAFGLSKAGAAAADLEQAVGGTAAVFGEASGAIDTYAKKAAQAAGLSEREFREATTSIGGQLKGVGFATGEAADQAVHLTKVAADLAATYGGTTADAVAALGSAFRGEADPAERFNLRLGQTAVNAKAVELGLADTTTEVSAHAKAQATLALITEQSADALGQFGREADSAAGAQARMRAEMENAVAALGAAVAPAIADAASAVSGLVGSFNSLPGPVQDTISKTALYGTAALGAAGSVSFLAGKLLESRERFQQLSTEMPRTSKALGGLGRAAATLGPLILLDQLEPLGFLQDAAPDIDKLTTSLTRLAGNTSSEEAGIDMDKIGAAIERITEPSALQRLNHATRTIGTLGGALDFGDKSDLDKAREQVQGLDAALTNLNAQDPNLARTALAKVAQETGATIGQLEPLLDEYTAALDASKAKTEVAAVSTGTLHREYKNLGQLLPEISTKFDELTETLRASIDADFAYEDSIDSTEAALHRLAEAQGIVIDKETTRAEKFEEIDDATRAARDALIDQADAAAAAAEQNALLADKTFTAADRQKVFRDELAKLAGTLSPDSPLRKQIDDTITRLDLLAINRSFTITATYLEDRTNLAAKRDAERDPARRAIGGPVTAGSAYLVNEYATAGRGVEWFAPANGTISPAGAVGGGGVDQTVNITVNGNLDRPTASDIAYRMRVIAFDLAR